MVRGINANLRFFSCGFLRFPANICGLLRKSALPKCSVFYRKKGENLQKSEKICCKNLRLGSVCPLRFVPLSARPVTGGSERRGSWCWRLLHVGLSASSPRGRESIRLTQGLHFGVKPSPTHITITHKKITELIPKQFRFGNFSTQITEYYSQRNSVRDSVILCSHFLPSPSNSRNNSVR